MSWSVGASGTPTEVQAELDKQFSNWPLAEGDKGLSDVGEKATVVKVYETITKALSTFGPDQLVKVLASGHMGYQKWDTKDGGHQEVNLSIFPMGPKTQ